MEAEDYPYRIYVSIGRKRHRMLGVAFNERLTVKESRAFNKMTRTGSVEQFDESLTLWERKYDRQAIWLGYSHSQHFKRDRPSVKPLQSARSAAA